MLHQLSLEEFLELARRSKRVGIYKEIAADHLNSMVMIENLKDVLSDGAIFESGLTHASEGHHTFIYFGTRGQLKFHNNIVSEAMGSKIAVKKNHPFVALQNFLSKMAVTIQHPEVNFMNSVLGYIAYDAVRLFESIPDQHSSENLLPDMVFNFYETTLMFDHLKQTLMICMAVEIEGDPKEIYNKTQEKIKLLIHKFTQFAPQPLSNCSVNKKKASSIELDINDAQFIKLVERAKAYIKAGDIFQVVLSRCFKTSVKAHPLDIYRAMRQVSPAPYMFYMPIQDEVILGASPEQFIGVKNQQIEINPIAGTYPCSEKNCEQEVAHHLLNNKKEVAEHMMLVDLARNDLGVVCKIDSIKIQDLLNVKHYALVSHLTSVVKGELREDKNALDAFTAAFPAGTLSGAPKIRAMQIIDELETSRRGIYGGAICRLDHQLNLESCIAIRLLRLKEGIATVRTGAGIVYDSCPKAEAQETRNKAQSILNALACAEEELI